MALKSAGKLAKLKGAKRNGKEKTTSLPKHKHNVYEHSSAPLKKRARIDTSLTAEEKSGHARGDDDEGDDMARIKRRLVDLVAGEDTALQIDDDEEIDSDDAFEETDNERFAEFRFGQQRKQTKHSLTRNRAPAPLISLQEDEPEEEEQGSVDSDEEEEGEPEDFFDVLDILDGKADLDSAPTSSRNTPAPTEQDKPFKPPSQGHTHAKSQGGESDSDESSDDAALERLDEFIGNLPTSSGKRKLAEGDDDSMNQQAPRKRIALLDRTEGGHEGDHIPKTDGKLNIDDLLQPLKSSNSDRLKKLKKDADLLTSSKPADGPLPVPLPQRTQDRIARDASYQQTKKEVEKWQSTMKRIREAEHLCFPLQGTSGPSKPSDAEMSARFKPSNEMEGAVDRLLRSARLREGDLEKQEDLQMAHLSVEDVQSRRQELRHMRELMFRADVKAKRVAKIKSKTYRKLQRKSKATETEKMKEAGLLSDEEEDPEEQRLKLEIERARERATLRHKNTGKWAKSKQGKHGLEASERDEIAEQLDRGERLLRKIRGSDGSGEEGEDDDLTGDEFDEHRALRELKEDSGDVPPADGSASGIFSMKFMQQADARRSQQATREATTLLSQVLEENPDDDSTAQEAESRSGKMVFKPSANEARRAATAQEVTAHDKNASDSEHEAVSRRSRAHGKETTDSSSNPWLKPTPSTFKVTGKGTKVTQSKFSTPAEKSLANIKKQLSKTATQADMQEDAVIDISVSGDLTAVKTSATRTTSQTHEEVEDEDEDSVASEVEHQEKALGKAKKKKKTKLKQRDLVAMAFAGDNVVQEFEEMKKQVVNADAPREEDNTIPGWGAWGGLGVNQNRQVRSTVKIPGIERNKRSDANKKHVVISEKRDKKAAKFQIRDVPYPYTSRAQYEASLATPLGKEWNTQTGFQKSTLPRVLHKPGVVIEPLTHA